MTIESTPSYSLNQTREERLALEVSVVLLEVVLGSVDELHGDELVSSLLESADDLADESSLDLVVAKKRAGARGGWEKCDGSSPVSQAASHLCAARSLVYTHSVGLDSDESLFSSHCV